MKYMIMAAEPRGELERLEPGEHARRVSHHQQKLDELLRARVRAGRTGLLFAAVGLGPFHGGASDTITVRNRTGNHLRLDGPFAETRELLAGFDVIDFDTRDQAIEFAKAEHVHETHVAEVRPIREFWWISQACGQMPARIFMLSSIENERAAMSLAESERKQVVRQHQAVGAEYVAQRRMLEQQPGLWVGARLSPSADARTIRWTGGRHVTDGPFAETREVIGGFNLIACDSMEEAARWAQRLAARDGDAIEVRAVDGCWWIFHE